MESKEAILARWPACKAELQERIGHQDSEAWLNRLVLREVDQGQVVLSGVPNTFFKTRIYARFGGELREVLATHFPILGNPTHLDLVLVVGSPAELPPGRKKTPQDNGILTGENFPEPTPGSSPQKTGQTFENFVEGPNNEMALAFCKEIASNPGSKYNPLILVGAVGLGKTHLMNAVAEDFQQNKKGTVIRMTAEAFTNEVLDAIRGHRMKPVRERFRKADLLILDDLEFLLVSVKTQEELLHTFDALKNSGKQMVFGADRFPAAMQGMNPTLRSRLETGLTVEIHPLNQTTRLALIQQRAERDGMVLGEGVAQLLAEKISGNPRQIEGALVRLDAFASMKNSTITLDFAQEVAQPFFDLDTIPGGSALSASDVFAAIHQEFGTTEKTLRSRSRTPQISKMRKLAVYFLRQNCHLSFPEIGAVLGNRVHSTMIHAMRSAEEEKQQPGQFQEMVRRLERVLSFQRRN